MNINGKGVQRDNGVLGEKYSDATFLLIGGAKLGRVGERVPATAILFMQIAPRFRAPPIHRCKLAYT